MSADAMNIIGSLSFSPNQEPTHLSKFTPDFIGKCHIMKIDYCKLNFAYIFKGECLLTGREGSLQ